MPWCAGGVGGLTRGALLSCCCCCHADAAQNPHHQACGSGGTSAGLALGVHLAGLGLRVHAFGVCDDETYFYDFSDQLLEGMGATPDVVGADARQLFR